jgi:hypothetical protein
MTDKIGSQNGALLYTTDCDAPLLVVTELYIAQIVRL